ncbi:hypothetical protein M3Y95_01076400 [Aphelenchoides besseyi]|nr:hypothetical protein M3Y95_01076400 [Aphelenchoides besseyi]
MAGKMRSGCLLFALFCGFWIGNVDAVDATAACLKTTISDDEMKIHSCQSHAYEILWAENTTLDFIFAADVTNNTKFDMVLGDKSCSLSITSVKDNDNYVLNYRSYKAESGHFTLHLTENGKLRMGDNTIACNNVHIEVFNTHARTKNSVLYFAITQNEVKNFSITIKGKQVNTDKITQTLTTTTTTTIPPTTSTAVPIAANTKKDEKVNYWKYILIALAVVVAVACFSGLIGGCIYWCLRKKQKCKEAKPAKPAKHKNQQKKEAKVKVEQKLKPGQLRGKIIPGLPPPGPPGWEPDQIPANKFNHMGPLKMELNPPVNLAQEPDNDDSTQPDPNQVIVWDDEQNKVYDIGSEVEEVYRNGQRVLTTRRPPAQQQAQNTPRRSPDGRNPITIRED